MRWCFSFFLIFYIILFGCSGHDAFDVVLTDAVISEEGGTDKMSFFIINNESFELDCNILFSLQNGTEHVSINESVGIIGAKIRKKVNINFEMLYGESSIKISPACSIP